LDIRNTFSKSKFDISFIPATKEGSFSDLMGSFLFIPSEVLLNSDFARNKEFTFEVRYVLLVISTTIPSGKTIGLKPKIKIKQ